MGITILLYTSIILATGLLFGKAAKALHLPNVTGYLVGGLLLGPSVLDIIPHGTIDLMHIVSTVALGFIAFSIGNEMKISYFRRVGSEIRAIILSATLLYELFGPVITKIALTKAGDIQVLSKEAKHES